MSEPSTVKKGIEAIFAGLEKAGAKRVTDPSQPIKEALASKDQRTISQALSELIYSGTWSRDQMRNILRDLLTNDDVWIKAQAAERLYIIGDNTGRDELVKLMQSAAKLQQTSAAYTSGGYDLRIWAASLAAKFRDAEASSAVAALYQNTRDPSLLGALVKVGARGAEQFIADASGNRPSDELFELYGQLKAKGEAPLMAEALADKSLALPTRLAAAWAQTRVQDSAEAAAFIREVAARQIEERGDPALARKAVKYLGTLNDKDSVRVLERIALEGQDPDLVRVAVVNLVLNQPSRSSVGIDMVIAELTSEPTKLGIDLAVKLAATSADQRLMQAGRSFDARRDGEKIWQQQGEARLEWSMWSWADDYLIATNQ